MARKTVILHSEWDCFLNRLNDEELGQWLRAVLRLMETDKEPESLPRPVELAFYAAYERIQRDWESFDRRVQNLRQNTPKPAAKPKSSTRKPHTPQPSKEPVQQSTPAAKEAAPEQNAPAPDALSETPGTVSAPASQNTSKAPKSHETPGAVLAPGEQASPTGSPDAQLLALYTSHFGPPGPFAAAGLCSAQQQLGLALTRAIVEKAIANGARQWAYLQTSFDAARRQGLHSVEDYHHSRLRATGQIVDRPAQSGRDLLTRAVQPLGARLNQC